MGRTDLTQKLIVALSATFKDVKIREAKDGSKEITILVDDMFGGEGRFRTRVITKKPSDYKEVKQSYNEVVSAYLLQVTSMQPRFINLLLSQV